MIREWISKVVERRSSVDKVQEEPEERFPSKQNANVRGDNNEVIQNIDNRTYQNTNLVISRSQVREFLDEFEGQLDADGSRVVKRIESIRDIGRKGNNELASKMLSELLIEYDGSDADVARIFFNIGIVYHASGEWDKAVESLNKSYDMFPDNQKYISGKAFSALISNDFEQAKNLSRSVLGHDDPSTFSAVTYITSCSRLGCNVDFSLFSPSLEEDSSFVLAKVDYLREVQDDGYLTYLDVALEKFPKDPNIVAAKAFATLQDGRRNERFLLGEDLGPEFEENLVSCASILAEDARKRIKETPINLMIYSSSVYNAAVLLRLVGKTEDAAKLIDALPRELIFRSEELVEIRTACDLEMQKPDLALERLEAAERSEKLLLLKAQVHAVKFQYENACKTLETINIHYEDLPKAFFILTLKAQIYLNAGKQDLFESVLDELKASWPDSGEVKALVASGDRRFDYPNTDDTNGSSASAELDDLYKIKEDLDFEVCFRLAEEFFGRREYRRASDVLHNRVNFRRDSSALKLYVDSTLFANLISRGNEILERLPEDIKDTYFGWKLAAQVYSNSGNLIKSIPFLAKLHRHNTKSLQVLNWYTNALLRTGKKKRVLRLLKSLSLFDMQGTVSERANLANLLVYLGEVSEARKLAYQLYCENRSDISAWASVTATVLAFQSPAGVEDNLSAMKAVGLNSAFVVRKPNGSEEKYIVEVEGKLVQMRDENIPPDHPIYLAAQGKEKGSIFEWPINGGQAEIVSVKHKHLDLFHTVSGKFSERFPSNQVFNAIEFDPESSDPIAPIREKLNERATYSKGLVEEYLKKPIVLDCIGSLLGLDPIDTFCGLNSQMNTKPIVTLGDRPSLQEGERSVSVALEHGCLCDPVAMFLLMRLGVVGELTQLFGQLAVTQHTIDVFAARHMHVEQECREENGSKYLSYENGKVVVTERSNQQSLATKEITQSDLNWLANNALIVPAMPNEDPPDELMMWKSSGHGAFLDDLYAADRSKRLLLSEDLIKRMLHRELFGGEASWLQPLIHYCLEANVMSAEKYVRSVIALLKFGEDKLTIDTSSLILACELFIADEMQKEDLNLLFSILGGADADINNHCGIVAGVVDTVWSNGPYSFKKKTVTSLLFSNLFSGHGSDQSTWIVALVRSLETPEARICLTEWCRGHFLLAQRKL